MGRPQFWVWPINRVFGGEIPGLPKRLPCLQGGVAAGRGFEFFLAVDLA